MTRHRHTKERHRLNLLEYLGDWENTFPSRGSYPALLGIAASTLHSHFDRHELAEIEAEAVGLRKKYSAKQRANVYESMLMQAKKGSVPAQKEFLDRTEGKIIEKRELTFNGAMLQTLLASMPDSAAIELKAMLVQRAKIEFEGNQNAIKEKQVQSHN